MPSVAFLRSESVTHFVLADIAYLSLRLGVLRTLKGPLSARRTRRSRSLSPLGPFGDPNCVVFGSRLVARRGGYPDQLAQLFRAQNR